MYFPACVLREGMAHAFDTSICIGLEALHMQRKAVINLTRKIEELYEEGSISHLILRLHPSVHQKPMHCFCSLIRLVSKIFFGI